MSNGNQSSHTVAAVAAPKKFYRFGLIIFLASLLIACTLLFSMYLRHPAVPPAPTSSQSAPVQYLGLIDKLSDVDAHMQMIDTKIGAINQRLDLLETNTTEDSESNTKPTSAMSTLRQDLSTLSTTVSELQTEVKSTGLAATQGQHVAQKSLAATLAFIQLREAALSGHSYESELAALKDATKDTPELTLLADKLSAHSKTGIATMHALSEEFSTLETPTYRIIEKAGALTWKERLAVELHELISIRPLHDQGGPNSTLSSAEAKLEQNDLLGALEDLKSLPPETSESLSAWKSRATSHLEVDQNLKDLAAHLTTIVATP